MLLEILLGNKLGNKNTIEYSDVKLANHIGYYVHEVVAGYYMANHIGYYVFSVDTPGQTPATGSIIAD